LDTFDEAVGPKSKHWVLLKTLTEHTDFCLASHSTDDEESLDDVEISSSDADGEAAGDGGTDLKQFDGGETTEDDDGAAEHGAVILNCLAIPACHQTLGPITLHISCHVGAREAPTHPTADLCKRTRVAVHLTTDAHTTSPEKGPPKAVVTAQRALPAGNAAVESFIYSNQGTILPSRESAQTVKEFFEKLRTSWDITHNELDEEMVALELNVRFSLTAQLLLQAHMKYPPRHDLL
jgi:hypothetical protein